MPDQHPQDQPQPKPAQDWNQISAAEIEQTIGNAAELAYELAGDIGQAQVHRYRDTSGLEPIETALDVELKQLDHLVQRTKEQLEDIPVVSRDPATVPDFMSEFLTDEPVTVAAESATQFQSPGLAGGQSGYDPASGALAHGSAEPSPESKVGLVGVGTLGIPKGGRKTATAESPVERSSVPREKPKLLGGAAFWLCECGVCILEWIDRPLARLSPTTRRALSVTALAAFCTCLTMFLLALLFS